MSAPRALLLNELAGLGSEEFVSGWLLITQEAVSDFGRVTGDEQWIYTDPQRAAAESPFGATVAHGFLTLALIPQLVAGALAVTDARLAINYGLNRVRFVRPVPVGAELRARCVAAQVTAISGGAQVCWEITIEIAGQPRPAAVASWLVRYLA